MPLLNLPGDDRFKQVRLHLRLLGDFEARVSGGRSVLPVSKKARGLLALVAVHRPQPVRRDMAAALLWSDKPREHAANSLRQALREVHAALLPCGQPAVLLTGGGRLSLAEDGVRVDLDDPSAIRLVPAPEGAGRALLCQDLQTLDPKFGAHLERLWKNLVFRRAFDMPPEVTGPGRAGPGVAVEAAATGAGQSQGWRIAVLPFRCLGAPLESGLSLGMAQEVSAALARFRMPRLIATESFWDGGGPAADMLDRCRAFNLDYAISGTIQVSGGRVRVTVSLLDVALDFEVVWASRFEGTTADLFTLQDTIAAQTVARIDPELLQRQPSRPDGARVPDAEAHQALLTGIQGIYQPERERFGQARLDLQRAIRLDERYAAPHAWLAYWCISGVAEGWIDDPGKAVAQAGDAAERAVALDPLDARGLTIAGHVKAYLEHDLQAASALHERAIALNPNLPVAWTLSSWSRIYSGDHQAAVDQALVAGALSPADPHGFTAEHAAMTATMFLGDLQAADRYAASALERRPRHATALKGRLAILGHLGRREEAAACLQTLRELGATMTVDAIIARPPLQKRDRAFYAEGLRLAGITG